MTYPTVNFMTPELLDLINGNNFHFTQATDSFLFGICLLKTVTCTNNLKEEIVNGIESHIDYIR